MVSMPALPGITLGNIIHPEYIKLLKELEEAQKPQDLAEKKLNQLSQSTYKIQMIFRQMQNLGLDEESLEDIYKEMKDLKSETLDAAVELVDATLESQDKIQEVQLKADQSLITVSAESPLDYSVAQVEQFPYAFDSIDFDVQYFRKESNDDSNSAHASQISNFTSSSSARNRRQHSNNSSYSASESALAQASIHDIEGTVVISAHCFHKQADVIEPFVLDPRKAVLSWNATFPDDPIQTDPTTMAKLALQPKPDDRKNVMHLLSGCSKASSFVGYVHLYKTEATSSSQMSSSVASAVKSASKSWSTFSANIGNFGTNSSDAKTISNLVSTAQIQNSCNFHCEGVIPSIKSNDINTTLKNLKPSAEELMSQLGAIQGQSDSAVNDSMQAGGNADGMQGAQFMQMKGGNLEATVLAVSETTTSNKVIDMNSMMDAFTDYVDKCIAGDCGVPVNFFFKEVTKEMIAKEYVAKFYPHGASDPSAMMGEIGITKEEKEKGKK
mmetsp:Transcript_10582/g.16153  ORF Transcript_10582/g.16153 Transcript_10582/m.16153 type:complete len:498 (+) Transcript_10582:75-1568(+)